MPFFQSSSPISSHVSLALLSWHSKSDQFQALENPKEQGQCTLPGVEYCWVEQAQGKATSGKVRKRVPYWLKE